jgi:hypothetical protein
MTINKTKVHSLINRSVWDYQPYYVDKNSLDHVAIKDAVNKFQVPFKHVDEIIDQRRQDLTDAFVNDDSFGDINRFVACEIADDIAQIMTKCEYQVTFKIYLPCTSHY